ncbi:hypothetical protein BRD00_01520 [Halobacteriales archaeon QS_8_69_26]|nr:MAG: hypothetical protein BRD00_01520 [Halobacteriales archaeon QS_8_69_26]
MAGTDEREREPVTDADGTPVESALVAEDLALSYPTSEGTVVDCARLDVPSDPAPFLLPGLFLAAALVVRHTRD